MTKNSTNILFKYIKDTSNTNSLSDIARFIDQKKKIIKIDANEDKSFAEKIMKCNLYIEKGEMLKIKRSETWFDVQKIENRDLKKIDSGKIYKFWIIGMDKLLVKEAIKAELNDPEKSGYLLGYPKCCIERWAKLNLTQYWTLYLLENLNDVSCFSLFNNRLVTEIGGVSLIGEMFPCSLMCKKSKRIGEDSYNSLKKIGFSKLAQILHKFALKPLYVNNDGYVFLNAIQNYRIKLDFK